jgi:rhodanese-related sulfurtransferase
MRRPDNGLNGRILVKSSIIFLLLLLLGDGKGWTAEKTNDQLLEEARGSARNVSIQDVKGIVERTDKSDKIVLLDIRDMKDFSVDHIRGAKNMSRAVGLSSRVLEHHMQKIIPNKATRIVVYCEFDTKAPIATKAMNEIGYSNAVYMKGGLNAWKQAGYLLERSN